MSESRGGEPPGGSPVQGSADDDRVEPVGPEPDAPESRAPRKWGWPRVGAQGRREIVLALALLFVYGFFQQVPMWNENSRYDLVRAVVENGTTTIDRYEQNTGDKAFYNGHYYSDKAPGTALIGLPVYALLTLSSEAAGTGTPDPSTAVEALAFVECGIATVLLVLLLLRFLRPLVGEPWALVVSLGYGLGSIALPFATMFFGHAASAFFLFAAFYELWRWRADRRGWRPFLAGFLAGCAVITEIPVVLGVIVLGAYALWLRRDIALRFVVGGVPLAIVLMGYDWLTFGGPFSLGYQYATLFGEQNRQGIVSIGWPSLATAADLLLGPRGLVRLAPWFIVAPLGVIAYRRKDIRAEVVVCVAICVAFLAYNSGALNPFGGWTPGPRYLLPALPFAAILVALVPVGLRPLVACLIAIAVAVLFVATVTMPNAPEMYTDPLYQLWLPRLVGRDLAPTIAWLRWGLPGLQPLVVFGVGAAVAAIALVASFGSGRGARRLTAALAGVLVLMVVAFAQPFGPASAVSSRGAQGASTSPIVIADAGVTTVRIDGSPSATMWAQVENEGAALPDTRVVFTVLTPDGRQTWSAWDPNVSWRAGERRRVAMTWDTTKVAPGDYRVDIAVMSQDLATTYARFEGATVVHVGP